MFTKEMFKKWIHLSYLKGNHYEGWELLWQEPPVDLKTEENVKILNKSMIETYPFLLPRNRWTDKIPEDYDYDYNEWEAIPIGWQIAFGWELLNELAEAVTKLEKPEDFRIEQIKEKFGELRIYTNGGSDIWELIDKYTNMSQTICIDCGAPAKYISRGWICPFCEEHVPDKNYADKIGDED